MTSNDASSDGPHGWLTTTRLESADEYVTKIVSELETVSRRGYSSHQVFSDWLDLVLAAVEGDAETESEIYEKYDCEGPSDDNEIGAFVRAFGNLLASVEVTELDVLGEVFCNLGLQSGNLGQHFTPHGLAETMAAMLVVTEDPGESKSSSDGAAGDPSTGSGRSEDDSNSDSMDFDEDREAMSSDVKTICDPACGSGRLLLSASKRTPKAFVTGIDKDPICAKMTAVNLFLFDQPGYAIHGDALTFEFYAVWRIYRTQQGPRITTIDPKTIISDRPTPTDLSHDFMGDDQEQLG